MKSVVKFILAFLAIICFGGIRVAAQCPELYGITFEGGEYGGGTIFKTDGNGDERPVERVAIFGIPGPVYCLCYFRE
jgi:hypothetical protein